MSEWRGIESAPDLQRVILAGWVVIDNDVVWRKTIGRKFDIGFNSYITHWMPLPEPPTT